MISQDQTAVIPRQRDPLFDYQPVQRDRWVAVPERGPDADLATRTARAMSTLAWLLPMLIMAALGFVRATWPSLSITELRIWGAATTPWSELVALAHEYESPYPLLLHWWAGLAGTSDLALRAPSIIFMAAAAALVGRLGTRLASPRVGFLAGLLFAAVPVTSRLAQEAGPQALALLTATLASVTLVRLLDRPAVATAAVHALASMALLSQVSTVAVVVAHLLIVATMRRSSIGYWLVATVIGAVPGTLIYLLLLRTPAGSSAAVPTAAELAAGIFGTTLLGGVVTGLAVASFSTKKPAFAFTVLAVLPVVGAVVLAKFTSLAPLDVAVVSLPGFACLAAYSLRSVPVIRGVIVFAIAATLGFTVHRDIRTADGHGLASRTLATTLATEVRAGDVIVYGATDDEAASSRDIVARYLPKQLQPKDVLLTGEARRDGRMFAAECPQVAECLANAPRVWVIRLDSAATPLDGFPAVKDGALRVNYQTSQRWDYRGVTLFLLTLKGPKQ